MDPEEQDVPRVIALLSRERLQNLVELTGSQAASIGLHQETLNLGCELMMVIATVEIALRNTVVDNLSKHFGVANWLQQPPVNFQWREMERKKIIGAVDSARRAKYSKMNQSEKAALEVHAYPNGRPTHVSHLQRAKARRAHIPISEGNVIAELTFHFWKRLFGPEYEQTLWKPSLKRTFPNKKLKRAQIAEQLEIIYQARNRLAHHEPVLRKRFSETISAINFVSKELAVENAEAESALYRLLKAHVIRTLASEKSLTSKLDSFRAE